MIQKRKQGISLIVLIITIVVIVILATAIIVNLAQTNIIGSANEATVKQDFKTMQEELQLYIANKFAENKGKFDITTIDADTTDKVKDILKSSSKSKYIEYVVIEDGKIAIIETMPEPEKTWAIEAINSKEVANKPIEEVDQSDVCKEWLKIANIYSKYNYENLNEILSDENCLSELMDSCNAIDYMIAQKATIISQICASELGVKSIARSQYARYKVIEDSQWRNSMFSSEYEHYFASELSVPQSVSSATSYEGKLYSTDKEGIYLYSDNGLAYLNKTTTYLPLAFDSNDTTAWLSRTSEVSDYPGRFGIKLDKDVLLYKTVITTKNGSKFTDGICVQTSSDLENWSTVSDNCLVADGETTIKCSNGGLANTLVIYIPAITTDSNLSEIYSIEFLYEEVPEIIEVSENIKNWLEKANINVNLNDKVNIKQYSQTLMNSENAINYMLENKDILKMALKNNNLKKYIFESGYIKYKIATNSEVYSILDEVGCKEEFDNNNLYIPQITKATSTGSGGIYSTNVANISLYSYSAAGDPAYNNNPTGNLPNMFDRSLTTCWNSRTTATQYFPARIGAVLDKKMVCYKVEVTTSNTSKSPNGVCIQASNDLTTWNDITPYITEDGTFSKYIGNNTQEYKNYAAYIPSVTSSGVKFQIYELKLYLVEKFE